LDIGREIFQQKREDLELARVSATRLSKGDKEARNGSVQERLGMQRREPKQTELYRNTARAIGGRAKSSRNRIAKGENSKEFSPFRFSITKLFSTLHEFSVNTLN
jgi:hypothetical protein